jgi:hypothetical protein
MNTLSNLLTVTAGVALYFFAESFYYHVQARLEDRRMRLEVAAHEQYMRDLAELKRQKRVKAQVLKASRY